jgi:hypothetical protein
MEPIHQIFEPIYRLGMELAKTIFEFHGTSLRGGELPVTGRLERHLGSIAGAVPRTAYSSKMASSGRKCVRYVTVDHLPSKFSAVMRAAKSTDALNS